MTTANTVQKTEQTQTPGLTAPAPAAAVPAAQPFANALNKRPKRTTGLWLVDTLIYPVINNTGVFIISVFASYLTKHGWPDPVGKPLAATSLRKRFGNMMQARGTQLQNVFQKYCGMSENTAEMSRVVFFSFFDGTLVAPFVKVLEDRREQMAMGIDTFLGTKPKDESVYEAEPKQSWGSVIKGRLATSLIVVPTAMLLNKRMSPQTAEKIPNYKVDQESLKTIHGPKEYDGKLGLNDILFNLPGHKYGGRLERSDSKLKHGIEKVLGKVNFQDLFRFISFEFVYTAICTGGLYVSSRFFARRNEQKESLKHAATTSLPAAQATTAHEGAPTHEAQPETAVTAVPSPRVMQAAHMERVHAAPQALEVTA